MGFPSKTHNNLTKVGLIICCIPVAAITIPLLFAEIVSPFKYKPSWTELIGEYQITEVTKRGFDKSTFNSYKLVFKSDSTFTLTPTPFIDMCDSGKYELDYSEKYNELSYRCGMGYYSGHIERRFGDFRIEFIIGDPDSGESIFFKKAKTK